MFNRYNGTQTVDRGTYLCIGTGEFVNIDKEGESLPGTEAARYIAVSPILALLVGPLAGLLFVIFLPLAVPLFVLWLVANKVKENAPTYATQIAHLWRTGTPDPWMTDAASAGAKVAIRGGPANIRDMNIVDDRREKNED